MVTDTATLAFTIAVNPAPASEVVAAGLTAVPAAIREDAAATAVLLTFTLEAAAVADESVRFTIVAPSEGTAAVRDVDYTVTLGGADHYSNWRYRRHGDADLHSDQRRC